MNRCPWRICRWYACSPGRVWSRAYIQKLLAGESAQLMSSCTYDEPGLSALEMIMRPSHLEVDCFYYT
jgi:hypothetical protein